MHLTFYFVSYLAHSLRVSSSQANMARFIRKLTNNLSCLSGKTCDSSCPQRNFVNLARLQESDEASFSQCGPDFATPIHP